MTFDRNLYGRVELRSPCSLRVLMVSFVDAWGLGCPSQPGVWPWHLEEQRCVVRIRFCRDTLLFLFGCQQYIMRTVDFRLWLHNILVWYNVWFCWRDWKSNSVLEHSPFASSAHWRLFFKRYIERIVLARENGKHECNSLNFWEETKRNILRFYFDVRRRHLLNVLFEDCLIGNYFGAS